MIVGMNISNLESNDKEGGLPPDAPKDLGQSSIYSLTFDEFQNNHRELGKDFGSLNMDTLLKNIWTADDTQAVEACGVGKIDLQDASSSWIQRQGSITIPSTISQKTVDEVWRDLMRGSNGGVDESEGYNFINSQQQQQEPDLKEMTLEEFLLKAGVVQENITQTEIPMMPNCNNVNAGSTAVFGLLPTSDHQGNANVMVPNSKEQVVEGEQLALSRFYPMIEELILKLSKGDLPENEYSCMNNPSPTQHENSVLNRNASQTPAHSMRSRRTPTWAKPRGSDDGYSSDSVLRNMSSDHKKMGQRIFVFVIGGATRSELRVVHKLTSKLNREIILGSSSIDDPPQFITKLKLLTAQDISFDDLHI